MPLLKLAKPSNLYILVYGYGERERESRPIGKKIVTMHEHPVMFCGVGNRPSVLKCNELHDIKLVLSDITIKYTGLFKMPRHYSNLVNDLGST